MISITAFWALSEAKFYLVVFVNIIIFIVQTKTINRWYFEKTTVVFWVLFNKAQILFLLFDSLYRRRRELDFARLSQRAFYLVDFVVPVNTSQKFLQRLAKLEETLTSLRKIKYHCRSRDLSIDTDNSKRSSKTFALITALKTLKKKQNIDKRNKHFQHYGQMKDYVRATETIEVQLNQTWFPYPLPALKLRGFFWNPNAGLENWRRKKLTLDLHLSSGGLATLCNFSNTIVVYTRFYLKSVTAAAISFSKVANIFVP